MRYVLYKPSFFVLFDFFLTLRKFYDFFVSTFFDYFGTYIFIVSGQMFCDVDRLHDESYPPFSNLYRPYIYMKELRYFYEDSFIEQCFLDYFVPRYYLDLLKDRNCFNRIIFQELGKKMIQKAHSKRLSYNI